MAIRVGAAAAVFASLALWEWLAPRRKRTAGRRPRWPGNLGIWTIDSVLIRLLGPLTVVGSALLAVEKSWGAFALLGLPYWPAVTAGVVLLDLVTPWLKRIARWIVVTPQMHQVHHLIERGDRQQFRL